MRVGDSWRGANAAPRVMRPRLLGLEDLGESGADHLVDVREPLAYAAGHMQGAVCLPVGMIPAFAGWFISEGDTIALIASEEDELAQAMAHLVRIGLDNIVGGYVGVIPAAAQGKAMQSIAMIDTEEVARRLAEDSEDWTLLDVRALDERQQGSIDGSEHVYVGELNTRWKELDRDRHYTLMCASGMRASVAAGWLASQGFKHLDVYLGSMGAWANAQG